MDEVKLRSADGDDVVLTDTEKKNTEWVDGAWGIMADDRVVMRSDCDASCLDTAGYVAAENSRLASGYPCFVGKNDSHLQGTNNVTIPVYVGNYMHHCICNIRE
jgi:hypothetical protein